MIHKHRWPMLLVVAAIAGCSLPATAASVTPAPTAASTPPPVPSVTPTEEREEDIFPLAEGAAWTYNVVLDYADGTGVTHWEGSIVQRVTEATVYGSTTIFRLRVEGHPIRDEAEQEYYVWVDNRLYVVGSVEEGQEAIDQNGAGSEGAQWLAWPMAVDQMWGHPDMLARGDGQYVWRVEAVEDVTVPAGTFSGCYRVAFWTTPDHTVNWFCAGTGLVKHEYHHHGSVLDDVWELADGG